MNIKLKDVLLIPNLISILRVLLVVPYFFMVKMPVPPLALLIIVSVVIIASDFLDGILARKLNQTSDLGMILDPIGDKAILVATMIALFMIERIDIFLLILLIGKDLLILIGGIILTKKEKAVNPSNVFGKYTTTFLAFGFFVYIIFPSLKTAIDSQIILKILYYFSHTLISLGIVFVFLTLASYGTIFLETIKKDGISHLTKNSLFAALSLCGVAYLIFFYFPFLEKIGF